MLGSWTGAEADAFAGIVAPFERRTGIDVRYEGSRDVDAVLAARVQEGTPPELAALSSPGDLIRYARTGRIAPLDDIRELADTDKAYAPDWVTLGRVDGRRMAVVVKAALKSLLWYDPKVFADRSLKPPATWADMLAAARSFAAGPSPSAPWCLGLASSSASGWPGTDWIEDLVLARSGPDVYDRWVSGQLAWNSPEIEGAWKAWGDLLAAGRSGVVGVVGANGATGAGPSLDALLTPYNKASPGLVAAPPACALDHQGSFASGWYAAAPGKPVPGVDFDFTAFPAAPNAAGTTGRAGPVREVAGDVMAMFHDTPEARQLLAYLAGTEAQTLWVRTGALSPNRGVPLTAYPATSVAQALGRTLAEAEAIRFDGSDLMPTAMRGAFYRAVLSYIADPSQLDHILEDLDQARLGAYP
ncbi:ABC transporter substrate-binding protein [Yinghuangia seranimata]|uniref:ABC transporter substrate-binding protein n=1 Tax=Yinghuangia seranimata TaxID=408067 RepID=UPI00248B541E|nr:ABC transporter substrate-binding protein [Yinghuangia seranimata]MDI2125220.1 ABC transporter substrate-binding protein [Yinghuangia seranimata]